MYIQATKRPRLFAFAASAAGLVACGAHDPSAIAVIALPLVLEDGAVYSIRSASTGECAQATLSSDAGFDGIELADCEPTRRAQRFLARSVAGEPRFSMQVAETSFCLAVDAGSRADGAALVARTCDETARSQWWAFPNLPDGTVRIAARHSGKNATLAFDTTPARLVQQPRSSSPDQRFTLIDLESPAVPVRSIRVTLRPLAGGQRWVSFGLPMPPGVLADAANLRVRFEGGAEIPAFVEGMASWRAIPTPELLCEGPAPTFPGVRSVLIQFQADLTAGVDVPLVVEVGDGVSGARLDAGVEVRSTYRAVNDVGALYDGTEGYREPAVLAAIDHEWLACTGIGMMSGLSDQAAELGATDEAQRDFFYTAIANYKTDWRVPSSDWVVDPVNGPNLTSAEDGVWLYQRPQVFLGLYLRTGIADALRSFYQAFDNYRTTIYSDADCAGSTAPQWCAGFNKLKNPDRNSPYKDPKYSYSEDFASAYWLTGDETLLPYLPRITAAEKLGIANVGWTERFETYGLMAAVADYEVTGSTAALDEARARVEALLARQRRSSDGTLSGCWLGNTEWGPDGFSPWMSAMLMSALVRYYSVTNDPRIPASLVKQARCIVNRGMSVSDGTGAPELAGKLLPFYGARTTGPIADVDGDALVGVEHAINVAQGIAIGYLYAADPAEQQRFRQVVLDLMRSGEWAFENWTRMTPGRPVFRLSPWRKYNWWFRHVGQLQWAVFGKPTL